MSDAPTAATQPPPTATPTPSRGPSAKQIAVVIAILGAGILLTALTSDVTRVSEPGLRVVDDKPYLAESFGEWTGGELGGLSEEERKILPPDTEGARRIYTDQHGNQVFCSVVLAGRDVTSIHRPELCLPGQGWQLESREVMAIPTPAASGGTLKVMRMNAKRSVQLPSGPNMQWRSIFVYWFVGKNRVTPYHWERIFWTTKDRVLHNTNHRWAYLLINAQIPAEGSNKEPARNEEQTMQLITKFVQDLYPTLEAN